MTVLKIDSSARVEGTNSRIITDYLVQQLGQPVIERDLVKNPLPPMSPQDLVGVHGSHKDDRASLQQHLAISNELIAELQQADTLVLGVAMYNFSVPAYLKQWIDYVCRAGVSFRYTDIGPEGRQFKRSRKRAAQDRIKGMKPGWKRRTPSRAAASSRTRLRRRPFR